MEKIFYAERSAYPNSKTALEKILRDFYDIPAPVFFRSKTGKPYLTENFGVYFSISHTNERLFIAVSDAEVGIDAERQNRSVDYQSILKKFPLKEREEIRNERDFIKRWTIKESAVKYLGGTLTKDLAKLCFSNNKLFFEEKELPVFITQTCLVGHFVCICSERDFANAEFIEI